MKIYLPFATSVHKTSVGTINGGGGRKPRKIPLSRTPKTKLQVGTTDARLGVKKKHERDLEQQIIVFSFHIVLSCMQNIYIYICVCNMLFSMLFAI